MTLDRYHVHKPNPSGRPRKLHPAQVAAAPTADALRPHAARYITPALDTIRQALQRDPSATHATHTLPSRPAGSAEPARQLIAEALHPLGAQVGPLQRTRGTRLPYAVISWPAGWAVPESQTGSGKATPAEVGEESHDDAQNSC